MRFRSRAELIEVANVLDMALERAAARTIPLPPPPLRRALRITRHLTQDDLAGVLGVDRATVARWELGVREPRGNLRIAYASVLKALR